MTPQLHFRAKSSLTTKITVDKFSQNIKTSSYTSPGVDGITYPMLKPVSAKVSVCNGFNKIIDLGEDADCYKIIIALSINKSEKYGEFSPISLML